jgi:hypothetical protein
VDAAAALADIRSYAVVVVIEEGVLVVTVF